MRVLITGGSGLIGKKLIQKLIKNGIEVSILSRKKIEIEGVRVYQWDYQNNYLEEGAFESVDVLVHLAGEGIADKRWTEKRKQEIVSSRVDSIKFLENKSPSTIKAIIGGSGVGYYGGDTGNLEMNEGSKNGNDFLAYCCKLWEEAELNFAKKTDARCVIIRTGVVLSDKGGALPKIILPIKYYFGSQLGSGDQWMPWIHMDDLVELFYESITKNSVSGIINGVAPNPVTNKQFTQIAAQVLNRKLWLPAVPKFILKIILGEMAVVVTGSSKVIKKQLSDFKFKFSNLKEALTDLLR
jgi:uncharacterized protein (TIGR01777 family)